MIVSSIYLKSELEILVDGIVLKKVSKKLFDKYFRDQKKFENEDELNEWLEDIESKVAQKHAYFLLSYKNYPSHLLLQKLIDVGVRKGIAKKQVDECIKLGYVNDSALIEYLIKKEIMRGYGLKYIKLKLLSKHFKTQIVEVMLEKFLPEEEEKKNIIFLYNKLKNKKNKRQIYLYLLRKGFDARLICKNIDWQEI